MLGETMDEPLDCHELGANGDIIQPASSGKALVRPSVGIPTFTPAVVATHRANVQLVATGEPASPEIRAVAENGGVPGLVQWWHDNPDASHVAVAFGAGEHPPIMPGESPTSTIVADRGADRLPVVSMLVCTNDGFTGGAGLALPKASGETAAYMARAYDAGTERNTEDLADLVPPCQGLRGVSTDNAGGRRQRIVRLALANVGRGEPPVLCSGSTRDRNLVEPCLHLKKSSVSNAAPRKCAGSDFCARAT